MIAVYTASKLGQYAKRWRALKEDLLPFGIDLHARWYRQVELGVEETPENAAVFWQQDIEDVQNTAAVLVYGEDDEQLRGAYVEAGIALGAGIPVIVVTNGYYYGTWIYAPGVVRVDTLDDAISYLKGNIKVLQDRFRRHWGWAA